MLSKCYRFLKPSIKGARVVSASGYENSVLRHSLWNPRAVKTIAFSEERLQEFLRAEVALFGAQDPQPLSVEMVTNVGTPQLVAGVALRELPVRFAHRIQQIENLPNWRTVPDIAHVHGLYFDAFRNLRLIDLDSEHGNLDQFTENIQKMKKRMQMVVPQLAKGVRELERTQGFGEAFIQEWLDTFLLARIGTEMLTSQYITTVKAAVKLRTRASIVNPVCDPAPICEKAAKHVSKLCQQHFSLPKDINVKIVVQTEVSKSVADAHGRIRFPYIPNYLFYIVLELLKNSARATVESTTSLKRLHAKPIIITIGADQSQVAIRVTDHASGIPFSAADRVWSYMYSTAQNNAGMNEGTPLAGYGVGLPLSRLYARYLGGSLSLMSMPGVGTHAYLYLKRIGSEAREEVPSWSSVSSIDDPLVFP